MTEAEQQRRRKIAFHEAGHAVAAYVFWGQSSIKRIDMRPTEEYTAMVSYTMGDEKGWYSAPEHVIRECVVTVMGPFSQWMANGSEMDFESYHEVLWDVGFYSLDWPMDRIDAAQEAVALPLDWKPQNDWQHVFVSMSRLEQQERWRFLRHIFNYTREFGTNPTVVAAVERLAKRLMKDDFLDGDASRKLLQKSFPKLQHYADLGPRWKRRAEFCLLDFKRHM